ncbi:MAG: creatininase family protein [Proteobacteria bacterium]|nr:creatininase family protein [Pseudomonadota bacterium]
MTTNSGAWLEDLTWPEANQRFSDGALVLLPVGAASKAHGPHLPLKTDALTARALAQRLLERLPLVVAPVVDVGFYPAFARFAGSQTLSETTFRGMLGELVDGLRRQGARRLAILNVGVSTEAPIDAVCGGAEDLLVLHMRALGGAADALIEVPAGGHADERETSVVLALEPRSVRLDRLAPEGPFEATAATGDARRATAFKGERILAARVDDAVAALLTRWPDLASG